MVADEVHRCGAERWSLALEGGFERRLGLTATYEREDYGIERYLNPYFGGIVYQLGYAEALRDDIITHFRIAFIGVRFTKSEFAQYREHAERASKLRQELIDCGLPAEPFGEFMKAVQRLKESGKGYWSKKAGWYLAAFTKRREIMAKSQAKLHLVRQLAPAVKAAERAILFAQTKEAAELAVRKLEEAGVAGAVLTSDMDMDERHHVFAGFEDGEHELVAAPKLLDEGIDVPAADLAIVLAASRSRRQLIQRMGSVIRKKEDGRPARLAVLFVEGTTEDPRSGAQEDFLSEVVEVADDVWLFPTGSSMAEVLRYLCPFCRERPKHGVPLRFTLRRPAPLVGRRRPVAGAQAPLLRR